MTKVWLIGEDNPHSADRRYDLWPSPPNASGGRLCRILGMERRTYLRAFRRRNLSGDPAGAEEGRRLATAILAEAGPSASRFILLGSKVSRAFDLPFRPFGRFMRAGAFGDELPAVQFLVLPHPSGRCRIWNEPGSWERARAAVQTMVCPACCGWLALHRNCVLR